MTDELDRLLTESLHDAAECAPSAAGLLAAVHSRSRRYRRRRVVAAAVSLVAAIAAGNLIVGRPDPAIPTSALMSGWAAPIFPYTLPATDGMRAPVASMTAGEVSAFFEATELRDHADVTVTVSATAPASATGSLRVRGHPATLRTVDVEPAKRLSLYWQEAAGQWIELETDDTYTPAQVVALAGSLKPAVIPVLPPFELGLIPVGLVTDTVSASRMTFRAPSAPPGTAGLSTVLRRKQQLKGINKTIDGYDAVLARAGANVTLSIDVPDWNATLVITVGNGFTMSDDDLIRYASAIQVLNRSDPE
ncbi:hypothetical protein [Actinoplanes regularis]|uniref:hypothetical protein n=1 Tax=Actinoplanes regularis TaxID=52697 RepID=UPI0024A0690B|nr:hypothetical protein [Actinoplanes regularis]GLW29418.1 hypothetical protein Areg01_23580 [Actinoplanes regularis]